jgi:CBS domain-containing protein
VQYFDHGQVLFKKGDAPLPHCFLVKDGIVELLNEDENATMQLADLCGEGELFGLRSLISGDAYSLQAKVRKEALLYALPVRLLRTAMQNNGEIALLLANMLVIRQKKENEQPVFDSIHTATQEKESLIKLIQPSKNLISCTPNTFISEAAILMNEQKVSSIVIVDQHQKAVGIVTFADLARKVATGFFPPHATVKAIMSAPVYTVKQPITDQEAALYMLEQGIKHLIVSEDGTPNTKAIGIITDHDIQVRQRFSAKFLLKSIKQTTQISELKSIQQAIIAFGKKQLEGRVPAEHISSTIGLLHESLLKKIIALIKPNHPLSHVAEWCWVNMGSMARREQLFPTDQDNALIFIAKGEAAHARSQLLAFAQEVNAAFMECGFAYCPANMMASNPEWCLSLQEWKAKFKGWIRTPTPKNVMHTTIFFDMRPAAGQITLLKQLQGAITEQLKAHPDFLTFLAADALKNPPPLSFFGQVVVEADGAHKNEFDIKARALMPVVDAARLYALSSGYFEDIDTLSRLKQAASQHPKHSDLFLTLEKAFSRLLTYRFRSALADASSGRYLVLQNMSSYDRQLLKQCFKPISELQSITKTRFDTRLLRQ